MAHSSILLSLSVCFLVLFHSCIAQLDQQQFPGQQQQQQRQQRRLRGQNQCRLESLRPLEPHDRIEADAGFTEYWDEYSDQLDCAGVAATRNVIQPRGLLLPAYDNAPRLTYIVQGRGYMGLLFPGCPETYHSFQQSRRFRGGESRRSRSDQHQKIQHYREGDIIAIPAGVAHWCYNNGDIPLVTVSVYDTGNTNANQLDQNLRRFQIAGNQQRQSRWSYDQSRRGQQRQREANSLFNGFDVEILADVFGVSTETARRLQNRDDLSGHIIRVESGLRHVARPPRREREEDQPWSWRPDNGLEESICTMRIRENIGDPERADIYSPEAGRLTTLNSLKLPILNHLQLSAQRGVLYRNSIHAPQWHTNAHSIIYVTRGNARVQIVGNYARPVFNGELREGQLLVIPQNFAVVKESGDEGFEWISFKTNGNPITSHLAGKTSVLRGMPADVLANAFGISRDEANRLKYNREEVQLFRSRLSRSRQWTTASA